MAILVREADFGKSTTIRSRARQYINDQIRAGVYKPGDRIVETRLAKELNVSQAPVREAILELSVMGVLEVRPYSGTFVRNLTPEDIDDIYNTRAFLEEYAASRAAKRITQEELAAFDPLFAKMQKAADQADYEKFAACDIRFHEMVIEAAHSGSLLNMWHQLRLADWTSISLEATAYSLQDIINTHREIFNHIKHGADHSAGAEMFLHIRRFVVRPESYFSGHGKTAADAPKTAGQAELGSFEEQSG